MISNSGRSKECSNNNLCTSVSAFIIHIVLKKGHGGENVPFVFYLFFLMGYMCVVS